MLTSHANDSAADKLQAQDYSLICRCLAALVNFH